MGEPRYTVEQGMDYYLPGWGVRDAHAGSGDDNPVAYCVSQTVAERVAYLLNADDDSRRRAELLTGGDPA